MDIDEDDEITDIREQIFHNTVREHIIFMLLFILLYIGSFTLIGRLRRRDKEDLFSTDEDEITVYRISLWLCTFSLAVAIGAALMLPISIASNEVLLLYPNSYYVKWLNSSLIQGLWNYVFLFSNLSLFVLLPFSYLFTESSGFSGHKKGVIARAYETFTVFSLLAFVVLGLTYVISALFDPERSSIQTILNLGSYHLPFLYSCVSFIGVLMLLVCTPMGFVRLFGVVGQVLVKPHLLRDVNDEFHAFNLEEASLLRKLNNSASSTESTNYIDIIKGGMKKNKYPNSNNLLNGIPINNIELKSIVSLNDIKQSNYASYQQKIKLNINDANKSRESNNSSPASSSSTTVTPPSTADNIINSSSSIIYDESFRLLERLRELESEKIQLDKLRSSSGFQRNFLYPFSMLLLLFLTGMTVFLVVQNTLELLIGIKALPISTRQFTLGITSLSKLGPLGATLEIIIILYLGVTSSVGLYTMPFVRSVRPQKHKTSLAQLIANCGLVLILSSALPLLSRILGITNFDLLGDYGEIEWLGNFQIVLLYNLIFGTATTLCLVNKFTATVRRELCARLRSLFGYKSTTQFIPNQQNNSTINGFEIDPEFCSNIILNPSIDQSACLNKIVNKKIN